MKAERRHELHQNSLAKAIQNLPAYLRENGSKVALILVVIVLGIILFNRWRTSRTEEANARAQLLGAARYQLDDLRNAREGPLPRREEMRKQIEDRVADVLANSDDPVQQADAKLIRGDLQYYLALNTDAPDSFATTAPAAATRPAARSAASLELLKASAKDYDDIIAQAASLPWTIVATARFGRAAVAEERHEWPAAREQYNGVLNDARVSAEVKEAARARLDRVDDISKPVLLGPPRSPETQPATTTAPSTTQSTTGPTSGPATGATSGPATTAAPTTRP